MNKPSRKAPPSAEVVQPPRKSKDLWVYVVLFLATFLVYSQVIEFGFVTYDDPFYGASPHVQNGITADGLKWAITSGEKANWFPVTRLSHLLDGQLFGADAGWHHLTNVLFHSLAALLVLAFLRRATGALWRSAFVAFLFSLHPLHVESVAWVAERKDVLSAFFWFLTLWAYVRYGERSGLNRYLLVLLPFCLGLMSKPMVVTLPFVLLLLDIWPLKREWTKNVLLEKIPFFALSAVAAAVAYLTQKIDGTVAVMRTPLGMRIENAIVSYAAYIAKMFWPARLAVLYPYPSAIPVWQIAGAIVAIVAISVIVFRYYKDHPYLAVGWLWFLGTLVPVIGLVQVGLQARADRYTYIPMVGLSIMLAWGAADLIQRWPRIRQRVISTLAVACCLAMAATWIQLQYWKSSETLYKHAIEVTDGNYVMNTNLGVVLADIPGRLQDAIEADRAAVRIKPDFAEAHTDLADALSRTPGNVSEALEHYEAAVRIEPNSPDFHTNLGAMLAKIPGRMPDAIAQYHEALRINPVSETAHTNLAAALAETPEGLAEAIAENQAAIRINPASAEAHLNLGAALARIPGRLPEAIQEYETAVRFNPGLAEAHYNLGAALSQVPGRVRDAMAQYQAAIRLRPDYADAHTNLGIILAQIPGQLPNAASELQTSIRITPNSARSHANLGFVLARTPGRMSEAVAEYEAALRISPDPAVQQQLNQLRSIATARSGTRPN